MTPHDSWAIYCPRCHSWMQVKSRRLRKQYRDECKRFIATHSEHNPVLLGKRQPDGSYNFERSIHLPDMQDFQTAVLITSRDLSLN